MVSSGQNQNPPPEEGEQPTELDLTQEESPAQDRLATFQQEPYDPGPARERVRGVIASALIGILAAIVVGDLIIAWYGIGGGGNLDLIESVATTLLTPVVGLVGAVTGFYFGEQSRR
jgi:hypothetical protein